ncbi:MAG: LPS-assembly protein LptD, partial [Muribaculaceae bacterium]|nr:LPS-assembly protein LptD [Muribaculaceae bacterium]
MRRVILSVVAGMVCLPALSAFATADGNDGIRSIERADTIAVDTIAPADSTLPADTIAIPAAMAQTRPSRIVRTRVDLDNAVEFSAADSLVILRRDSAFMYGKGSVTYGDIKLDAAQIEMDLNDNTVYAIGRTDSLGELEDTPVFQEGGSEYEAKTMRYNFKTSKGIITNVITQQGEGYLTGGLTKKDVDDSYYVKDGRYTTCDDHEHPHFYLQLTKAKVKPGKNVITGPAYMVLAGLPLPIAVPFGYFPFSDK